MPTQYQSDQAATDRLQDVRFANRGNRGDFRLAIEGNQGRLTIREVQVRRLP